MIAVVCNDKNFWGSEHPVYGLIKKDQVYHVPDNWDFKGNSIFEPVIIEEQITSAQAVKAKIKSK